MYIRNYCLGWAAAEGHVTDPVHQFQCGQEGVGLQCPAEHAEFHGVRVLQVHTDVASAVIRQPWIIFRICWRPVFSSAAASSTVSRSITPTDHPPGHADRHFHDRWRCVAFSHRIWRSHVRCSHSSGDGCRTSRIFSSTPTFPSRTACRLQKWYRISLDPY